MKTKRNTPNDKIIITAISITFLLVLIIPLSYLSFEIEKKVKNHEISLLSTANGDLVNEIVNFQCDLSPTQYVERAMQSIIKSNLTDPKNINPSKFGGKCKKILEAEYGIKPDILVCTNRDLSNIYSQYGKGINSSSKDTKARDYLYAITTIYGDPQLILRLIHYLEKDHKPHASDVKKRYTDLQNFSKIQNYLKLGNFARHFPSAEKCRSYYSNELGHQRLFLYSHPIYLKNSKNKIAFYGTIIMGVTEENISPQMMLETVSKQNLISKTNRVFNKKPYELIRKKNVISIYSHLPPSFLNLVLTYNKKNIHKHLGITSKSTIGITLNKLYLKSSLRPLSLLTSFIIKCLILFTFTFWLKGFLFGARLPLGLRRKFLLIVAFITVLPSLFIASFSFFIYQQIEAFHVNKGKAVLSNNVRKFERIIYENDSRFVLNHLCLKNQYQKLFNNYNTSSFKTIHQSPRSNMHPHKRLVFDKYGNSKYIIGLGHPNPMLIMNGVKLLSNLGILHTNTAKSQSYIKITNFTSGLAGDLLKIIEDQKIFSSESEITNSPIHIETLSKEIFQLFTNNSIHQDICAVVFTIIINNNILDLFIEKILEQNPRLFEIKSDDYYGEIQIAKNSLGSLKPESILRQKMNPIFTNIFQTALQTKDSGSSMKTSLTTKHLFEWNYKDDSRYIIATHLELNEEKILHNFFLFLPAYAGTLAMIILIILSEIMADLFTSQISTLHSASENITSNNDFLTKVSIKTGDELENMSNRFNNMTTALQERKNISRFVSGKLISVLEENTHSSNALGEKVDVSVLSADIRNFTTITETYKPEIVVNFLNEYFTIMEEAIINHGGVIDKFIGDAIIAIFYTDIKQNHVLRACNAAIEMREALVKYNKDRLNKGLFAIENGIGIASGEVISGNVGSSDEYMEYTVVGQPIDTANMLEAASKQGKFTKIILDELSAKVVSSQFTFNKIDNVLSSPIYEIKHTNE